MPDAWWSGAPWLWGIIIFITIITGGGGGGFGRGISEGEIPHFNSVRNYPPHVFTVGAEYSLPRIRAPFPQFTPIC